MTGKVERRRSPINYMGSKYRSLGYIKPYLPNNVKTFVDVFGGSGTMTLNVKADTHIYNDRVTPLVELFDYLVKRSYEEVENEINTIIERYSLPSKEGYLQLREDYNRSDKRDPIELYTLTQYSFNYLMRFNLKGEFNAPYGHGHSKYSVTGKEKLKGMEEHLKDKTVYVYNKDYKELVEEVIHELGEGDFIYFDPPYEQTTASYNENRGYTGWTNEDAEEVLEIIDKLDDLGIHFGYSNSLISKGEDNERLYEWLEERPHLKVVTGQGYNTNIFGNSLEAKLNREGIKNLEAYITNR